MAVVPQAGLQPPEGQREGGVRGEEEGGVGRRREGGGREADTDGGSSSPASQCAGVQGRGRSEGR